MESLPFAPFTRQPAMNLPPTDKDNAGATDSEAKRFTYAGGSRPLDGFTGEQALNVIKIIDGIYRSSDAGKEVAID